MADFFAHFSCILDVGTAENAMRAEAIRGELAADLYGDEGGYPGFSMEVDQEAGPGALWIYRDEYGEPEHVIQFVLRCAEQLSLKGLWGFTWSLSCSKPRVGLVAALMPSILERARPLPISTAITGSAES